MRTDKADIVYFVKNASHNEELRYSLRSIEKNFPHATVWIYGFCPYELNTDRIVNVEQMEPTKWQNTRKLMAAACANDDITPDFWLFNDDFFIMKPITELPPLYDGDIITHIEEIKARHGGTATAYTNQLEHLAKTLKTAGYGTKNYAIHKPMLINRAKMRETLEKYPDEPMLRALYGNMHNIGGQPAKDCKIAAHLRPNTKDEAIISTDDFAFANLDTGDYIRAQFPDKCKYEVD